MEIFSPFSAKTDDPKRNKGKKLVAHSINHTKKKIDNPLPLD